MGRTNAKRLETAKQETQTPTETLFSFQFFFISSPHSLLIGVRTFPQALSWH